MYEITKVFSEIFEISRAVLIKIQVFWNRFKPRGGAAGLHHPPPQKMEIKKML